MLDPASATPPAEPASLGIQTRSIHAGEALDPSTGAVGVPLYQNATYGFRSYAQVEAWRDGAPHFLYAREGNPTVRCLELKVADLEGAEAAVGTATGMAALSATLLHLLPAGAHLVASTHLYATTRSFLCDTLASHGVAVDVADFADPVAVAAAVTPRTRALLCEAFSNPTLRVADIAAAGEVARAAGATLVVDNTFLSPALLRPLAHGADVVVHSATKYLSGHGYTLGGVVAGRRDLVAGVTRTLSALGATMPSFAAWLLLAGAKTLPLRVERHSTNAARLARLLAAHPAVAAVYYPGLPDDPGHAVARHLVGADAPGIAPETRFGGMLAFRLAGGNAAVGPVLDALRLPTIAVSLGDCASLIWPVDGTGLVRLSVGLEDIADLEADFAQALDRAPIPAGEG